MLKRKDWPSNPYLHTRGKYYPEAITVIAFIVTPTGRWAKVGGIPRFYSATAYRKEGESIAEATLRAVEHWQRNRPCLPRGDYRWTDFGIY